MSVFTKPEIQIFMFENKDIIVASAGRKESFRYAGSTNTTYASKYDFSNYSKITDQMLAEFKSQIHTAVYREYYTYNYDTHTWSVGSVV